MARKEDKCPKGPRGAACRRCPKGPRGNKCRKRAEFKLNRSAADGVVGDMDDGLISDDLVDNVGDFAEDNEENNDFDEEPNEGDYDGDFDSNYMNDGGDNDDFFGDYD